MQPIVEVRGFSAVDRFLFKDVSLPSMMMRVDCVVEQRWNKM